MAELKDCLRRWGTLMWRAQIRRSLVMAVAVSSSYLTIYFTAVLLFSRLPLTLFGTLAIPALALLAALAWIVIYRVRSADTSYVAKSLEQQHPSIDLKIRTALDFAEERVDLPNPSIGQSYIQATTNQVIARPPRTKPNTKSTLTALATTICAIFIWFTWDHQLMRKFSQPLIAFSETQLVLEDGSITIFEPDYTNIPGRTLALKSGRFEAYPGSKVRFSIVDSRADDLIWLALDESEDLFALQSESHQFSHEFLLLKPTQVTFLMDDHKRGGQTQPFVFETKRDTEPDLQIKSHTPEGAINALDPLYIDTMVKDDFGVAKLEVVVQWDEDEKRLPLQVPNNQRTHFVSKNRWSISDLVPDSATAFSVFIEAADNNPINGPGIGRTEMLHFELESPERKHDELVELARQLLDRMSHVLGDNLDTVLSSAPIQPELVEAKTMSEQIQSGLFQAQSLTNTIMALMREDPYITTLDQDFIREFNSGLTRAFRQRIEMGQTFAAISRRLRTRSSFADLGRQHGQEEVRLEQLTYDLLLQLKMWALMDMERNQEAINQALEDLQKLIENSEQMNAEEMEAALEKMLEEIMKELQEMFAKAAQEMDQTLDEFMNREGMEFQQDQLEQLKQEMMEAMRNGDMEKLKELLEQFREMMMGAMSGMQQAMGEMSPEMQQMMQDMREMMGLLNELKEREEQLQAETQELKAEIDEAMGGNPPDLSESQEQASKDSMERIQELLKQLHEKLVDYQNEDTSRRIINQITELKAELERDDLGDAERRQMESRVRNAERTLDFIMRDSLDHLQDITLKSLDSAERMSALLEQGELMHSLDVGFQLENKLLQGERLAERGVSDDIQKEARPKETFAEARDELYNVMEALQNLKQNMEQRRRDHMTATDEQRQQQLAQEQESIRQMISEFEQRVEDSLGGSQVMERLDRIGLSMKNAERKLQSSNMDGGLYHEQDALRQIGEMMEQMQQSMKPGQMRPQFMQGMKGRQESMYGDPTGDVYIPESERALRDDQIKDLIRRQLQKNFPDSFGKEIKQYYETLMDQ